jgi:hypothetical protein
MIGRSMEQDTHTSTYRAPRSITGDGAQSPYSRLRRLVSKKFITTGLLRTGFFVVSPLSTFVGLWQAGLWWDTLCSGIDETPGSESVKLCTVEIAYLFFTRNIRVQRDFRYCRVELPFSLGVSDCWYIPHAVWVGVVIV